MCQEPFCGFLFVCEITHTDCSACSTFVGSVPRLGWPVPDPQAACQKPAVSGPVGMPIPGPCHGLSSAGTVCVCHIHAPCWSASNAARPSVWLASRCKHWLEVISWRAGGPHPCTPTLAGTRLLCKTADDPTCGQYPWGILTPSCQWHQQEHLLILMTYF